MYINRILNTFLTRVLLLL